MADSRDGGTKIGDTLKEASDVMEEYITKKEAMELLQNCLWGKSRREAIDDLLRIKPADVVKVVPGRWIPVTSIYKVAEKQWPLTHIVWVEVTEPDEANGLKCSVCGDVHGSVETWNWCANCGAKMNGE